MVVEYPTCLSVWEIKSTRILTGRLSINSETHAKSSRHREIFIASTNSCVGVSLVRCDDYSTWSLVEGVEQWIPHFSHGVLLMVASRSVTCLGQVEGQALRLEREELLCCAQKQDDTFVLEHFIECAK